MMKKKQARKIAFEKHLVFKNQMIFLSNKVLIKIYRNIKK